MNWNWEMKNNIKVVGWKKTSITTLVLIFAFLLVGYYSENGKIARKQCHQYVMAK